MNPFDLLTHQLMTPLLTFFHQMTGAWGAAIMLLTLTVRTAILPLSVKQFRSMKEMQEVQPKMKALQEQYKSDPQELNRQMMAFYSENKINPFGGCLPAIIQLPIFIALYSTLTSKSFIDHVNHEGFLWGFIPDLTRLGYFSNGTPHFDAILFLGTLGVTTYFIQKVTISDPKDPTQQQMLKTMPIMMTVMFALFPVPVGVLLYWFMSNLYTLGQYKVLYTLYPRTAKSVPASQQIIDVDASVMPQKGQ
jgi:YidC/Oxa1 family membrane protein insertase